MERIIIHTGVAQYVGSHIGISLMSKTDKVLVIYCGRGWCCRWFNLCTIKNKHGQKKAMKGPGVADHMCFSVYKSSLAHKRVIYRAHMTSAIRAIFISVNSVALHKIIKYELSLNKLQQFYIKHE